MHQGTAKACQEANSSNSNGKPTVCLCLPYHYSLSRCSYLDNISYFDHSRCYISFHAKFVLAYLSMYPFG